MKNYLLLPFILFLLNASKLILYDHFNHIKVHTSFYINGQNKCQMSTWLATKTGKNKKDVLKQTNKHTNIHMFKGLFSRTTWVSRHKKGKPFCILLKQEMMGWQWHQLDHMQIICTTLQTDNHTSTPSLNFLWAGCFPDAQPTVSKH